MGNSASTNRFDIHELERAFWYAQLRNEGDFLKSGQLVLELNTELLLLMAEKKDNGLSLVQDLIAEHPDAGQLPYYGDPAGDDEMQQLLRARAWLDGGPQPSLDPLLTRQIQLAVAADGDRGRSYIEDRIRQRTVQSYTTRHTKLAAPAFSFEDQVRHDKERNNIAEMVREKQGAHAQFAVNQDRKVQLAIAEDNAWLDPRVRSALQNAAVKRVLESARVPNARVPNARVL